MVKVIFLSINVDILTDNDKTTIFESLRITKKIFHDKIVHESKLSGKIYILILVNFIFTTLPKNSG